MKKRRRIEQRTLTSRAEGYLDWPLPNQVLRITRHFNRMAEVISRTQWFME
jgi:hypothetical protein